MLTTLLAASLASREAFELVDQYGSPMFKKTDKMAQLVFVEIKKFYSRDATAQQCDTSIVLSCLMETVRAEKHQQTLSEYFNTVKSKQVDVSVPNVKHMLLQAQIKTVKDKLAVALVNGDPLAEQQLLSELSELQTKEAVDDPVDKDMEITTIEDAVDMVTSTFSKENMIKLRPNALNKRVGGGVIPGNHVLFFGRPNSAKSLTAITNIAGFLMQGLSGLMVINEDPTSSYWLRFICNMTETSQDVVLADFDRYKQVALEKGLNRLTIVSLAPGTPKQIEALVERYRPEFLVVDQISNLNMGGYQDSRTNELEDAAKFMRKMGKKYNLLAVSLCQAGDSAENKQILDMNDVYNSKTGIQGALDVQVGIGVDKQLDEEGLRIMSIVKNKRTGKHENFPVKVRKDVSRMYDV